MYIIVAPEESWCYIKLKANFICVRDKNYISLP